MAKSSSFFGLRRGSTKSLTFSVLDGKQITKDRVTSVRNPKSNGQIMQRMRMKAAQIFQKTFKKYIERGQEGYAYGVPSFRKWLSKALQTPSLYAAKNQATILPWTFPLTSGSLQTIGAEYNGNVKNINIPLAADDITNVTDAQIIAANPNLQDGDQIAIVALLHISGGGYAVKEFSHILGESNTAANSLGKKLDDDDWDPSIGEIISDEGQGDTTTAKYLSLGYTAEYQGMAGCAVIHSRLSGSSYLRSTEEFATDTTIFTPTFCNICVDSWRDAAQRSTDWPEIVEEGFVPMYAYYVLGETEDVNGNAGTAKVLAAFGFNGNEFKVYGVNSNPQNPSTGQFYAYPSLEVESDVRPASVIDLVDGYISKTEFDAIFG